LSTVCTACKFAGNLKSGSHRSAKRFVKTADIPTCLLFNGVSKFRYLLFITGWMIVVLYELYLYKFKTFKIEDTDKRISKIYRP
jgi:hypothetical protein